MNRIAKYARCLEVIAIFISMSSVAATCFIWLTGSFISADNHPINNLMISYTTDPLTLLNNLPVMPIIHRLLGLLADGIALVIFLYAIVYFVRLMRCFKTGNFFSSTIIDYLKHLCTAALAWAIYHPIHGALLSVITSWHNLGSNTGDKAHLSISISTHDLVNIGIFGLLVLITAVIKEGYSLQQERDLTV